MDGGWGGRHFSQGTSHRGAVDFGFSRCLFVGGGPSKRRHRLHYHDTEPMLTAQRSISVVPAHPPNTTRPPTLHAFRCQYTPYAMSAATAVHQRAVYLSKHPCSGMCHPLLFYDLRRAHATPKPPHMHAALSLSGPWHTVVPTNASIHADPSTPSATHTPHKSLTRYTRSSCLALPRSPHSLRSLQSHHQQPSSF